VPVVFTQEVHVPRRLRLGALAAVIAALVLLVPVVPNTPAPAPAHAGTPFLTNCYPSQGSPPATIDITGSYTTKARACVWVSGDGQTVKAYIGFACFQNGQAHNVCRWGPDPLQLRMGTTGVVVKSTSGTVPPAPQFTSNAVFYGGAYDPLGCGIDEYFYSRLAAGNVRYSNGTLAAMGEISSFNDRIRLICV
jgi:hypothetical protein